MNSQMFGNKRFLTIFSRREKAGKGCQITANFGLMQENKTEKCNKNTSWLIAGRIEKRDGGIRLSLT